MDLSAKGIFTCQDRPRHSKTKAQVHPDNYNEAGKGGVPQRSAWHSVAPCLCVIGGVE